MADPTWSFRQTERIKLKLYIAAKKDRSGEIDGKLEELGIDLEKLTQQGNPNATPAELVEQEQQINALRQQRDQLKQERDIISQARTRLGELQK
tara:strand:- start:282 stop:563 length:282 start_codon:yes stop_codon:yes gene_type:complete